MLTIYVKLIYEGIYELSIMLKSFTFVALYEYARGRRQSDARSGSQGGRRLPLFYYLCNLMFRFKSTIVFIFF